MTDSTPEDVSSLDTETDSWAEAALDDLDAYYADAIACERIQESLSNADEPLTLEEIIDATELGDERVEDVLEILTRERLVAVEQDNDDLVFSIDTVERQEYGGERLEVGNGERVYEVTAAETERGKECVRILEKRQWEDDYEHTVGGVVVPRDAIDIIFSMLNVVDERFVYDADPTA